MAEPIDYKELIKDPLQDSLYESFQTEIQVNTDTGETYYEDLIIPTGPMVSGIPPKSGDKLTFKITYPDRPNAFKLDTEDSRFELQLRTYIGSTVYQSSTTPITQTPHYNQVPQLTSGLYSFGLGANEGGIIRNIQTIIKGNDISSGITGQNLGLSLINHLMVSENYEDWIKIIQRGSIGGYNGIFDEDTYNHHISNNEHIIRQGARAVVVTTTDTNTYTVGTTTYTYNRSGLIYDSELCKAILKIQGIAEQLTYEPATATRPAILVNRTTADIPVLLNFSIPLNVLSYAFHRKKFVTTYEMDDLQFEINFNDASNMEANKMLEFMFGRIVMITRISNTKTSNELKKMANHKNVKLIVNNSPLHVCNPEANNLSISNRDGISGVITGLNNASLIIFEHLLRNINVTVTGNGDFRSAWEWQLYPNAITSISQTTFAGRSLPWKYDITPGNTDVDLFYSAVSARIVPPKRNTLLKWMPLVIATASHTGTFEYITSTDKDRVLQYNFRRTFNMGTYSGPLDTAPTSSMSFQYYPDLRQVPATANATIQVLIPNNAYYFYINPYTQLPYTWNPRNTSRNPQKPALMQQTITMTERDVTLISEGKYSEGDDLEKKEEVLNNNTSLIVITA